MTAQRTKRVYVWGLGSAALVAMLLNPHDAVAKVYGGFGIKAGVEDTDNVSDKNRGTAEIYEKTGLHSHSWGLLGQRPGRLGEFVKVGLRTVVLSPDLTGTAPYISTGIEWNGDHW